jgi:hypothetical protein
MIENIFYISLGICFVLICLYKWGVLDTYEAYRKSWMPKAGCFFCIGWWLSWVVVVFLIFWELNLINVIIPFFSSVIIHFIMSITVHARR